MRQRPLAANWVAAQIRANSGHRGGCADGDKKTTVTKKSLVAAIAAQAKLHPNEVRGVIQGLLDQITEALVRGEPRAGRFWRL